MNNVDMSVFDVNTRATAGLDSELFLNRQGWPRPFIMFTVNEVKHHCLDEMEILA